MRKCNGLCAGGQPVCVYGKLCAQRRVCRSPTLVAYLLGGVCCTHTTLEQGRKGARYGPTRAPFPVRPAPRREIRPPLHLACIYPPRPATPRQRRAHIAPGAVRCLPWLHCCQPVAAPPTYPSRRPGGPSSAAPLHGPLRPPPLPRHATPSGQAPLAWKII